MKNKSSRHKETNTFKFQPFAERIANIDVDIFHKVEHEYETQTQEDECFLFQSIQKWNVLNLSESYDNLRKDIQPHSIITLPQLLHKADHVAEVLWKHLQNKNILCLQPLLEFVVALAKDLRKEFYSYYPKFLNILFDLLNTKDTDQLEWTFHCLAYLFKFLWRSLIKDISTVFITLLPLLSDSKPDYINNFAAESFAFVTRKVKDKKSFLQLILKVVKNEQDGVSGCAKLFFEVTKGVNGQFHSCAEIFLPFLFESLFDNSIPQDVLFEILENVITNIVTNIQPSKCEVLWSSLYNVINKEVVNSDESTESNIHQNLHHLLVLTGQAIEYKNGKFLQNPAPTTSMLKTITSKEHVPEDLLLTAVKIAIVVLLSPNVKLPQEQASTFTRHILGIDNKNIFLYFVEHMSEYSGFEALILPAFLKYCVDNNLDAQSLHVLTKLILKKSPLSFSGINLNNWKKYAIDFNSKIDNRNIENILIGHTDLKCEQLENYMCALICLPHLNVCNMEKLSKILQSNIEELCKELNNDENEMTVVTKRLFLLNLTLQTTFHLNINLVHMKMMVVNTLLPHCNNVSLLVALKALDLYFTANKQVDDIINIEMLHKINAVLETNFGSPYHQMRLYTAHMYTLFEKVININDDTLGQCNVFTICYDVESKQTQVNTYRHQLQNLEKLNYEKQQMSLFKNSDFKTIPLHYLCGVLYINFKLLWDPVGDIITSFAHGMKTEIFWEIYLNKLKSAVVNAKDAPKVDVINFNVSCEFLEELYKETSLVDDKPDFINHRILLWKTMSSFPNIAEIKTRDSSELLLNFVEEEYMRANSEVALTCNIKQNSPETQTLTEEDFEDQELNNPKQSSNKYGKNTLRSLLEHLKVFSKIKSPKSMYREPELYKLYFDLLSHKNYEVQKVALDCIMTYKPKYLTPYQSNLYKLIDDKNFKNELATFRVDKESNMVQDEHREQLMPIVMRIVFSKMFAKIGLRTGGKSSGQLRRTLVLRFLAGCHENEMLTFIHMTFKYYSKYFNDDCELMVNNISSNINLEKFIPPKRLQSTVNLINVVIEQFGGLMGNELLKYVLKIIFIVGASVKGTFELNAQIHSGYLNALRNVRSSCIKMVERFFQHFETYPWTSQEINSVFKCFVFPYLDKLHIESIHTPTPLLKLFILWGSIPNYFPLLVNHETDNVEKYALPYIMKLLLNEKCNVLVVNAIMEMVEKLITLKLNEDDVNIKLTLDNLIPIKSDALEKLKLNEKLNYGSCILLPHISCVLEKIKIRLKNKSKNINQRELFILSRVSELVWEAEISDTILELLLPVVLKKCTSFTGEEIVLQYTTTIFNLLKNVQTPQKHLKQITPLFGEITHASARKVLCNVLESLSENCNGTLQNDLRFATKLINELNAWDPKWIDQPDHQRRLDGFKEIQKLNNENAIGLEFGIILIYNCFYLIKCEKDISLKESASYCLKTLAPVIVNKNKTNHNILSYVLDETLLPIIRNGLKSKSNQFRNECILLLGVLARECADTHVVLRDLNKLTNKVDLEVDFFENITHLQIHRHIRALLKFGEVFKNETILPNTRTLTQFILPLTSYYLCNEKYLGKNSMIDAAIETIGVVCKLLPWHQYEGILKYYLSKLRYKVEFQRQLVRLVVAILDSFHFDLKKGYIEEIKVTSMTQEINKDQLIKEDQVSGENNVESEDTIVEPKDEDKEIDEALEETEQNDEEIEQNDEEIDQNNDEIEQNQEVEKQKICDKVTVLCKSTATRVIKSIKVVLLPQLHKTLAVLTQHESSHKVNRKKTGAEREEEDLLKVPISLALVKLLQKLPKVLLELNLPGIFMKLCTFLKSQLESVRRAARETLQKIMLTIGPGYLGVLLEEIIPLMTRGYQVHVLVYTVHSVLTSLKDFYQRGDIDKVLLTILELCKMDLFGTLGDEKEVAKIISKTSEAKSTKSYDTFQIVSQYITDKCFMDLLLPIKNVLVASHSFKTVVKIQDCLRHIALGLMDNQFVPLESLLKFSYGISSESIPELLAKNEKPKLTEKEVEKLQRQKEDCMIIPKEPVYKSGFRLSSVKKSAKTNSYVLIEFGLRLCHLLLKRDKVKNIDFKSFMDPFVTIFKNCLTSTHVKLCTVTLQCLSWVLKYELPTLKSDIKEITESMFNILHKYAAAGLSKGDNFDLVVAAFKTMTVLVRDVKYHTIEMEQLKVLLLYVEQDLHNYEKQATAFGLLKAIISRKLVVPELHDIMQKVAELSIVSEATHVRLQSRLVFHQYIMDYPLGIKLDEHVAFYLKQLDYEVQTGRESALEMVQSFINSFPYDVLKSNSATFLITLGARLINDESPECKKIVSNCLTSMFKRLQRTDLDSLFDIMILWFNDNKISHKTLAAQLCGIVIAVEKSAFESRLPKLNPLILTQFGLNVQTRKPGQYVLLKHNEDDDDDDDISLQRAKDHHIFLVLQMLLKVCANCPSFLKDEENVDTLATHVQGLLAHPHEWVRLASSQFLGYVLSSLNVDILSELLITNKSSETPIYLHYDPCNSMKTLALDLCAQLQPGSIKAEFAQQIIKNLVFVARVLQKVPIINEKNENNVNLLWLTKRMRKIVNMEVVETPSDTILRTEVFKWIAGVVTALEISSIKKTLNHLLAPLVREMITIEESNAPLRQLSKQVGNMIKKRIGMEEYMERLSKLQQHLSVKRAERKRTRNQLAVTDPEIYAKKKIKRHEKKKEAKKRKINERKGVEKRFKRRKVVDLDDNNDVI